MTVVASENEYFSQGSCTWDITVTAEEMRDLSTEHNMRSYVK